MLWVAIYSIEVNLHAQKKKKSDSKRLRSIGCIKYTRHSTYRNEWTQTNTSVNYEDWG
jgi:hypothetical protein